MKKGMTLADLGRLETLMTEHATFEATQAAVEAEFSGVTVTRTATGLSLTSEEEQQ